MKKFSFILLFIIRLAASAQERIPSSQMAYHLSWDGKSSHVFVDLYYYVNKAGTTSFVYGTGSAGQSDIFSLLQNIKAGAGDSVLLNAAKNQLSVIHKDTGLKKLSYSINGALVVDSSRARVTEFFRPVVAAGSLYLPGFDLFFDTPDSSYKTLSVVWDKWPENVPYLISSNMLAHPGDKQVVAIGIPSKTLAIYMDKDFIIHKYTVAGSSYFSLTSKKDTINNMEMKIKPFFESFFPAQHSFWNDYQPGDYYMYVMPFMNNVKFTYGGFSMGPGFYMKYKGAYDSDDQWVIAHETCHRWLGNNLQIKPDGEKYMWFKEGFNDYVATYLLATTGMVTKGQFVKYINEIRLKPYATSPVRFQPADSISAHFWSDNNYTQLSYNRGFIYAFYLDNQIRLASGNTKNLRHLLVALNQREEQNKTGYLTLEDFISITRSFVPNEDVAAEVNNWLIGTQVIDFRKVKLVEGFKVSFKEGVPTLSLTENADIRKIYSWK